MFNKLLLVRYVFSIAVVFLLLSSFVFLIAGAVHSFHGLVEFVGVGFIPNEETRPGLHLLEGLDAFMIALVFFVFGLGIARLFIFSESESKQIPGWLNVHNLKELKVLLWETILVTLVILCVSNLIKFPALAWESLVLPILILILSLALFLMRGKESH
jgi:uncharacterized membrane protein YqhA